MVFFAVQLYCYMYMNLYYKLIERILIMGINRSPSINLVCLGAEDNGLVTQGKSVQILKLYL